MTSVRFSKFLAVILAAMLMLTLLTTAVLATDADVDAESSPASSEAAVSSAEPDETEAPADDADETQAPADDSNDKSDKEEKKPLNWDLIISLSIIGIAVVTFVVLYFAVPKFHVRVNAFCREYKSELGKVVWSPLRDVKQNTAVVIIIVAVSALLIGVLDFIFSKGIIGLGSLL